MDQDTQKSQLKQLIAKGKEQGYLTFAEVNDHLPDGIVEPEQVEDIIRMINEMGITVSETPPDDDEKAVSDNAAADDDAAEAAAAALASVDSEFGRTTDPVRMYMREMGTVELLTREGELRIAKRIEAGLFHVSEAISVFPPAISAFLSQLEKVDAEEARITDVITGFIDPDEDLEDMTPPVPVQRDDTAQKADESDDDSDDDSEEEIVDTGPDPEEVAKHGDELKKQVAAWYKALDANDEDKAENMDEKVTENFIILKISHGIYGELTKKIPKKITNLATQKKTKMEKCLHH